MNSAFAENPDTEVIILQEAWRTYPAATITGSEAQFAKPDQAAVARAVDTDLMRYISNEFGPKIRAIQDDVKAKGSGTAAQYNSLGLLYIRAGMYEESKAEYQKSAALGSVSGDDQPRKHFDPPEGLQNGGRLVQKGARNTA